MGRPVRQRPAQRRPRRPPRRVRHAHRRPCASPTDPTGGVRRSALRADSFAELGSGAVGLVLDSSGLLAVSMDQRSAAEELGLAVGDQVTLTASDDGGLTQPVTLRRAAAEPLAAPPVASRHAPRHHVDARLVAAGHPRRRGDLAPAPLIGRLTAASTRPCPHRACSAPPRQDTICSDRSTGLPRGNSVNLAHIIDGHDDDSVALDLAQPRHAPTANSATRSARSVAASPPVGSAPTIGSRIVCRQLAALRDRLPRHHRSRSGRRPAQPDEPGPELQSRAGGRRRSRRRGRQRSAPSTGRTSTAPPCRRSRWSCSPTRPAAPPTTSSPSTTSSRRTPSSRSTSTATHLAVLMFTSGTAGSPRAAMLTHGNLLANLDQSRSAHGPHQRRRRDLRRAAAVPHLRAQRGARARTAASAPRSCSCSGSTRRPPSSRSAIAASPSSPARRRCGRRSPTSTSSPPTPSPRCASRCPVHHGCRSAWPHACANASASRSARATGSPRRRRSSPPRPACTPRFGSVGRCPGGRRDPSRRRRRRRRARRRRR